MQNSTYQSLTPEPEGLIKPPRRDNPDSINRKKKDDENLSFRIIPGTGWRTTIDKVIKSGWFIVEIDLPNNHVGIKPHPILEKQYGTMKDWVNTYYSANNMPHIYSQKLMNLCDFGSWRW